MFPTERSQAINIANEAAELSLLVSPDNLLSVYQTHILLARKLLPRSILLRSKTVPEEARLLIE